MYTPGRWVEIVGEKLDVEMECPQTHCDPFLDVHQILKEHNLDLRMLKMSYWWIVCALGDSLSELSSAADSGAPSQSRSQLVSQIHIQLPKPLHITNLQGQNYHLTVDVHKFCTETFMIVLLKHGNEVMKYTFMDRTFNLKRSSHSAHIFFILHWHPQLHILYNHDTW